MLLTDVWLLFQIYFCSTSSTILSLKLNLYKSSVSPQIYFEIKHIARLSQYIYVNNLIYNSLTLYFTSFYSLSHNFLTNFVSCNSVISISLTFINTNMKISPRFPVMSYVSKLNNLIIDTRCLQFKMSYLQERDYFEHC